MKKNYLTLILISIAMNFVFAQCDHNIYSYTPYPPTTQAPECAALKPCGIFVIVHVTNANPNPNSYQGHKEYYDGIYIDLRWNELQPQSGVLDAAPGGYWDKVKDIFQFADDNQKQVSIGVKAGENTPDWAMGLGYSCQKNIKFFGDANCETLKNVPAPWDLNFISNYNSMISLLRHALQIGHTAQGTKYVDMVRMVKLEGVNMNSDETKLPVEDNSFEGYPPNYFSCNICDNAKNCADDMVTNWVDIGYTPDKVINAWQQIQDNTSLIFADKYIDLVVLPDPNTFPPIDCNGYAIPNDDCPVLTQLPCSGNVVPCGVFNGNTAFDGSCHIHDYNSINPLIDPPNCHPNITDEIVYRAVKLYRPCLAINSTFLNTNASHSAYLANRYPGLEQYALIGYQMMHYVNPYWTGSKFIDVINNGLNAHASFIEIHEALLDYFAGSLNPGPPVPYTDWMDYAHRYFRCMACNPAECVPGHRMAGNEKENENNITVLNTENEIRLVNEGAVQSCHFTVYDMMGKNVTEKDFIVNPGETIITKNDFNLASSHYVFKIDYENGSKTIKLFFK
jgi:hypothetical protein